MSSRLHAGWGEHAELLALRGVALAESEAELRRAGKSAAVGTS
ncbi:hypothetical protein [Streptomyces pratensis]